MSSEDQTAFGAFKKTLRVFAVPIGTTLGLIVAVLIAVFLSLPRPLIIALLSGLIAVVLLAPYVWFAMRSLARGAEIPLLWVETEEEEDHDVNTFHLEMMDKDAFGRVEFTRSKRSFDCDLGSGYLARDFDSTKTEVGEGVSETRYSATGFWRGSLDPIEFEKSGKTLVKTWENLIPYVMNAIDAEASVATETMTNSLDVSAALMGGIENDVMFDRGVSDALDTTFTDFDGSDPFSFVDQEEVEETDDVDADQEERDDDDGDRVDGAELEQFLSGGIEEASADD